MRPIEAATHHWKGLTRKGLAQLIAQVRPLVETHEDEVLIKRLERALRWVGPAPGVWKAKEEER